MATAPSSIFDHLDSVATVAAGLFAGSALYITIVDVPALRALGLAENWRFFPLMYKRAAASQGVLALVAGAAGIAHGTRIVGSSFHRNLWFAAGGAFIAMWPYTVFVLFPTNQRIIKDNELTKSGTQSQVNNTTKQELLDKWAVLHFGRTLGSLAGFGAMIFGLSRHTSLVLGW